MKIAIIAHDGKKAQMVQFLMSHLDILKKKEIKLVSTGTTGKHANDAGLKVEKVLSGPLGGDAQIGAEVATGSIHMGFFFRDPLDTHPHEPDINMLMRLCDVHNVPLATNPATAEILLRSLVFEDV
ncbi:MAG: methylglyoxal synthase [Flavobacteriales bacterium]|nr:methylglyoxal synthase [Flavobacteriales bacterium]